MTRVHRTTESLRRTWKDQRDQMTEEHASGADQSGRRRSAADQAELQAEIDWMTHLISLPLGTPIPRRS